MTQMSDFVLKNSKKNSNILLIPIKIDCKVSKIDNRDWLIVSGISEAEVARERQTK